MSKVKLYCPNCGKEIILDDNIPMTLWYHQKFGWACSRECHQRLEHRYARIILRKDDLE